MCVLDGSHFEFWLSSLCLTSGLVLHTLRLGWVVYTSFLHSGSRCILPCWCYNMLNPLSKLLYFQNRGKKKEMQKLHTLSEAGVCLVVVGCFAYAGGIRCTVRSCLELTNTAAWDHLIGTFLVYYPIFSVCRMPVVPEKHFLSGHHNPSLPPRQTCRLSEVLKLTWRRTVYIHQQPTGATGQ